MQDSALTSLSAATDDPFGLSTLSVRPRKSPQAVEVLAIADATASSEPFSRGIKQVLVSLAESLPQRIAKVEFGLVASRDADCGQTDEQLLTHGDGLALQHSLERLRFISNADPDETHFWSVRDALGYPWDEGPMRRRAIVLLGSSDSKPIPGMTLEQLALELMRRRIAVFVVAPGSTNLRRLAELTDGLFFELSNDPAAQEVQRLVQRLTASMTQTLTGGAVSTVVNITGERRDRAYENGSDIQRYLWASSDAGAKLSRIGDRYGLSEQEYRAFAIEVVGDVVLGLRSPSEVHKLVQLLLHRSGLTARDMTRDILEFLSPLSDPRFRPPKGWDE